MYFMSYFFQETFENYGIDYDEPLHGDESETDEERVTVPELTFQLGSENHQVLDTTIDPLGYSENYGIDIYFKTVKLLNQLILSSSTSSQLNQHYQVFKIL